LEDTSFEIYSGETFGLIGETGCGKSVTALSALRLIPDPPGKIISGEIIFKDKDLLKKTDIEMQKVRGNEISMIFQEPMTALNPVFKIGNQISEVILLHEPDDEIKNNYNLSNVYYICDEKYENIE